MPAKGYRYLNRDDLKEIEESLKDQSAQVRAQLGARAVNPLPEEGVEQFVAGLSEDVRDSVAARAVEGMSEERKAERLSRTFQGLSAKAKAKLLAELKKRGILP